jgi:hypothetical protein
MSQTNSNKGNNEWGKPNDEWGNPNNEWGKPNNEWLEWGNPNNEWGKPNDDLFAELYAKANAELNKPEEKEKEGEKKEEKVGEKEKVAEKYKKREIVDPKIQLLTISKLLLQSTPEKYSAFEMEAKFGTRGIKRLTKTNYDNVVKKLQSMRFQTIKPEGTYSLKIQPESMDMKTGQFRISNDFDRFRVEINGLNDIQEYCKNGNIQHLFETRIDSYVSIMKKTDVYIEDKPIYPAEFNDFNFRVTYKKEEKVSSKGKIGSELISNWDKLKKQYRYINRVTFTNPDYPFQIDLSIV